MDRHANEPKFGFCFAGKEKARRVWWQQLEREGNKGGFKLLPYHLETPLEDTTIICLLNFLFWSIEILNF